jgi:hypothetical protein
MIAPANTRRLAHPRRPGRCQQARQKYALTERGLQSGSNCPLTADHQARGAAADGTAPTQGSARMATTRAIGGAGVHGSAVPSLVTGPVAGRSPGCGRSWRCRSGSRMSPPLAPSSSSRRQGQPVGGHNDMRSEAFVMSPLLRPGRRRSGPAARIEYHQRPPDAGHCERHQNGDDDGQAGEDHGLLPSVAGE